MRLLLVLLMLLRLLLLRLLAGLAHLLWFSGRCQIIMSRVVNVIL